MKKMKKILCILLVFMVAAMAFPTVSFGANEIVSQDGNWRYIPDYNKDTCTVIGYYGSDANVSIPSVVDDLKLTSKKRTATTATLKWSSVSGAVGYRVYKKTGSGSYKLLKTVTGTSYKATGLKKGTTYRFYVTMLKEDALGNLIESKGSTVYKTYLKK